MNFIRLFIVGLVICVGGYYLRRYVKGSKCHLSNRIDGKNVLITGANTGIGLATATELALRGGIIHLACRDNNKCDSARKEILTKTGVNQSSVFTHTLDLASIKSILRFSHFLKESIKKLDILVNNAGVFLSPYKETEDGFEMHIGVNHLGHFLLVNQLLDLINLGDNPRIIIVSSIIHNFGSIDGNDINLREENYNPIMAYAQSKLANILHATALARRLKANGVAVVSLHPGAVATEIHREFPEWFKKVSRLFSTVFIRSPEEGSQTQLCCAVNPNLIQYTGEYFDNCQPMSSSNNDIYNTTLSEWLWTHSDDLIRSKLANIL